MSRIYKAKAPMRIGFFGGGTDVSPYPELYGGKVLNCTIDTYVRCMLRPTERPGVTIRSLDLQTITHTVTGRTWDGNLPLPEAVMNAHPAIDGVEVVMFSDVPPGSGLGSSSALVVAMLKLVDLSFGLELGPHELARLAYRIEREDLGIPGGWQDQYAAAFGGMNVYHFNADHVIVEPVVSAPAALLELESSLVIGFIGDRGMLTHHVVDDQVRRMQHGDTLQYHHETKAFVDEAVKLLRTQRIPDFGRLLDAAWQVKKAFSPHIASTTVDEVYALARKHGAWGGKLSGAGGGGFMCFCCPFERRLELEEALIDYGVRVRPFSFTTGGVQAWTVAEQ
ncbi:MAG: GHMP kinase [Herpetosiphonaceae bacterium]|nr:GHMP kinase [Herpetosiphonaceae bacterium]